MKVIQRELSDMNGGAEDDVAEIEKRLAEADLPEHVRKKAENEFRKLKAMQPASSEAAVVRNYLEVILDTPWNKASKVSINLNKAQEILDADHYGLDDVKDRIVEYLAVQSRVKNCVVRFYAWLVLQVLVKLHSVNRLPKQLVVSSCVWRSAAYVMKLKFAVTVVPISVRCQVRLCSH